MRIIIDIDQARDSHGKRAVRARTKWYANAKDDLRVHNCGVEIYEALKDGFGTGFVGGIIEHQGEQK